MKLMLTVIFLGALVVTSYRSVPGQTDSSPDFTSIGERCNPHGVAVSQDLLAVNGGPLHYGDTLFIEGVGWRVVNDTMNARWKKRLDIWVPDYESEHRFYQRYHSGRLRAWWIQASRQEN